jgi:hypothetical protein
MSLFESKAAAIFLVVISLNCTGAAQKVKVGFDKTVDFSKFRTYSWRETEAATNEPFRRAVLMAEIEAELERRGLKLLPDRGDLILDAQGGLGAEAGGQHQEIVSPVANTPTSPMNTVWSGAPVASGNLVLKGNLVLNFVDSASKTLVWEGTVSTKMDNANRDKNLKHLRKAIAKLLERFPPHY